MTNRLAVLTLSLAATLGCKPRDELPTSTVKATEPLGEAALQARLAELGVVFSPVAEVHVDVENTTAFWAKADAIAGATRSIDMAYFLYGGEDYSSAYVSKLLLEKAAAGVKVRILVDAKTALDHRAFFKMLVAKGRGNLQVAYFRPVPQVVLHDFKALGLDPDTFVAAVESFDLAKIKAAVAGSPVLAADAALLTDLTRLVETLAKPDADKTSPLDRLADDLAQVKAAHSGLHLQAGARDWFDLTKWTHHKLLVVDGTYVQGGGRNMEDAYHWEKDHKIRVEKGIKKYVFMDVDYYTRDAALATRTLTTYDAYVAKACAAEPPLPAACPSQIPIAFETASTDGDALYREMLQRAGEFLAAKDYPRTYTPIHKGIFSAKNAKVAYAENRMFPAAGGKGLLYEEKSQHNQALTAMIDALGAGQDVIFQNAYLYFPADVQLALMRALRRGANVTILSNSPESSDLGYVAQAARLQYRSFLKMNDDPAVPGRISIYEYVTEESLHAKLEVIGDRFLVVGSVNADPRCELLDTNNGVVIDDPALAGQYKAWLMNLRDSLLNDRHLLRQVDQARLAMEDAQPLQDVVAQVHAKFRGLAAATFDDSPQGDAARKLLQAIFLQY